MPDIPPLACKIVIAVAEQIRERRFDSGQPTGEIEVIDDDGHVTDDDQTGHRNHLSRRMPQDQQPQHQVKPDLRNRPPWAEIGLNGSKDGISFDMTSRERRIGGYDVETGDENEKKRQDSRRCDQM